MKTPQTKLKEGDVCLVDGTDEIVIIYYYEYVPNITLVKDSEYCFKEKCSTFTNTNKLTKIGEL